MSSSMRNAIQRRSHRERAQPLERKRLGLLEKHKDYSLRARDWNKKKATLKSLREKAAERNDDEFSFKMLSGTRRGPGSALTRGSDQKRARHWDGTVTGDRGGRSLSVDAVRLLKTQDTGYVRTMRNVAAKEVAVLVERAALAGAVVDAGDEEMDDDDDEMEAPKRRTKKPKTKQMIVFSETSEERDAAVAAREEEDEEEDDDDDDDRDNRDARRKAATAARLRRRLAKARQRLAALAAAEHELDLQRARMAKTATMDMVTRTGKRIKVRERKR